MKFCYIDECGNPSHNLVNTMCGILIDYTKIRKYKQFFEDSVNSLFKKYELKNRKQVSEIKTYQIYEGKNNWSKVEPQLRKNFILESCKMVTSIPCEIIFSAIEFKKYHDSHEDIKTLFRGDWQWLASNVILQIQSKNFNCKRNKGNTLVVFDDHYGDIPNLYHVLLEDEKTYDFYKNEVKRKRKKLKESEILNQIIDILAIQSDTSPYNQLADIYAYILRRYIEKCLGADELYPGDNSFITKCFKTLQSKIFFRDKFWNDSIKICNFFKSVAPENIKQIIKNND